jgi:hypothetical protein
MRTTMMCTRCSEDRILKYKRISLKPYVCQVCLHSKKNAERASFFRKPTGTPERCITCRIEFMRQPDGPLQCPRCDAQHKHNLSHLDKGQYT